MEMLINDATHRALLHADEQGLAPSARDRAEFLEKYEARTRGFGGRDAMTVSGSVAEIEVSGVLTRRPDLFLLLFGGGFTLYGDLQAALAEAKGNPSIKRVVLHVDSPGGAVDGLFDVVGELEHLGKPVTVRARNAFSAAYAIAAAAGGPIEATSKASGFGSVGVAVAYFTSNRRVEITNTDSPDKRPDVKTEAGKAVVRRHLDQIHDLLVDAIARGRKTTGDRVRSSYGRGAAMLAIEAKRLGMIDRILDPTASPAGSEMAQAERVIEKMNAARVAAGKAPQPRVHHTAASTSPTTSPETLASCWEPRRGESQTEFARRVIGESGLGRKQR